jgi:hypothetical protein
MAESALENIQLVKYHSQARHQLAQRKGIELVPGHESLPLRLLAGIRGEIIA